MKGPALEVDTLTVTGLGGKVQGVGHVQLPSLRTKGPQSLDYHFALVFDNLQLSPWLGKLVTASITEAPPIPLPTFEALSGTLLIGGGGGAPEFIGDLAVTDLAWQEGKFEHLRTGMVLTSQGLHIDYFSLQGPSGSVDLQGRIGLDRELDFIVTVDGLEVGDLQLVPELAGEVAAEARLSGQYPLVEVEGVVVGDGISYRDHHLGGVETGFRWRDGNLVLSDGKLRLAQEQLDFSGQVTLADQGALDLRITADQLDLGELATLVGQGIPVTGQLAGGLEIKGWIDNLRGEGTLTVTGLGAYGVTADQVTTEFHWQDQTMVLDSLVAQVGGGRVSADGVIDQTQGWNLLVQAQGIDLEPLNLTLRQRQGLQGLLQGQGKVTGDWTQPRIKAEVTVIDGAVGGYRLDELNGQVAFAQGIIHLPSVSLRLGADVYRLSGEVDLSQNPRDPALDLQLDLAQASLEGLTLLFPEAKELAVAGPVAGYAQVWGRISDPSGEAQVMVRDGRMLDQPLAATVDLALQDGILTLKESQVHWGEATLTGQGQIANWQELALKFQARRIPLEQLPGSLSVPAHLSGQIDGDLMITGTRTRPKVRGTISLAEAQYQGHRFTQGFGEFFLDGARMHLDRLTLQSAHHTLTARGQVDLALPILTSLGIAEVQPRSRAHVDLRLTVAPNQQSPKSVNVMGAVFQQPRLMSDVVVQGTWQDPKLEGQVEFFSAEVVHGSLPEPARGVKLTVELAGHEVILRRLDSQMGRGKVFGSGVVFLDGLVPGKYDLTFQVDGVSLAGDFGSGRFFGELGLAGTSAVPVVRGSLRVDDGRVNLKLPQSQGGLPRNVHLDIHLRAKEDVLVQGFGLDMAVHGDTRLQGTLQEPQLDGTVKLSRGSFNYLGTRFQLTSGSLVFAPINGYIPWVDLRAETNLTAGEVILTMRGRADQLDITLRSDQDLSQQELMAQLGWPEKMGQAFDGRLWANLDSEVMRLVEGEFVNQFLGDLTRSFRTALSLDKLEIEPSFIDKNLRFEVGKYVDDRVFVTYSRKVSDSSEQEIGVEYRLNPNVVFATTLDGNGEKWFGFRGQFRF